MCGVLGVVASQKISLPIDSLLKQIEHRGPDDTGWLVRSPTLRAHGKEPMSFSGPGVVLGHRRLSILDLSPAGWQPMSSTCGNLHLSFNGEIYNFPEIRDSLKNLGHRFSSHCDSEVLLAAWQEWGKECLVRLKGMYAFCVLDEERNELYAVRDPFGIKPLHFAVTDQCIAFCSEIPPLLDIPGVTDEISLQFSLDFVATGIGDTGPDTIFSGVQRVEPGTVITVNCEEARISKREVYYRPTQQQRTGLSFDAAAAKLRDLFLDSVRIQMRSDVPIGACLSGGIDSSAIVCAMRHIDPKADLQVFTFISNNEQYSEEKWARLVADHTKAVFNTTRINPEKFDSTMSRVLAAQVEPIGTTTILAQYEVFRLIASKGVKVVLDGQGADEMLGGYTYFRAVYLLELIKHGHFVRATSLLKKLQVTTGNSVKELLLQVLNTSLPDSINTKVRKIAGWGLPESVLNADRVSKSQLKFRYTKSATTGDLQATLRASLRETGLQHLLRYEDRNSMAFSIESRVPFLLPEIVDFVQSLPSEYLIGPGGETKRVFRAAMRGIVPDPILDRKDKIGFKTEESTWLAASQVFGRRLPQHPDVAALVLGAEALETIQANLHKSDSFAWIWRLCNLLAMPTTQNAKPTRA